MSRPPYPHRCIGAPSDGTDFFDWTCQCGALPDVYGVATARDGWGSDCPIALREALAETEARAERAEAERDEMRRELAEAGSRYRDHLPAVMAATEPVELDRPMVMAEVVGERSCFTCKYDHHRPGLAAHWCSADGGTDPRFGLYMVKSGALGTDDLMPTNRTMRCPGWAPKEPT